MSLNDLDQKIAEDYIKQITDPIRYGENGVFFWFPGAGMTTILREIFSNKALLKKYLGKLAEGIKIEQFWGQLSIKKNLAGLLEESGYSSYAELSKACTKELEEGYEIVYVLHRIDDFPENEKLAILKMFLKLNSINPRRIHILFQTRDKPWFMKALSKYTELLVLATRMEIVPVLQGKLLEKFIKEKSADFGFNLTDESLKKITQTYGGVLQVTKEYLRSNGNDTTVELKLRLNWDNLPESYKEILKGRISGNTLKYRGEDVLDLAKFGVLDLKLFDLHKRALDINPENILKDLLTEEELNLWNYCKKHEGEFLDKDVVINLLRPGNEDASLWAIDQAVSRFRKKLAKSGVDPSLFKTLKGRGYIWQN